jgi:hypothetical protein
MADTNDRVRPRALVTGASSGIGQAFGEHLAANGYDVVVVARRRERLEELATRLRTARGVGVDILVADLATASPCEVEERVTTDDSIQMLVNNAGVGAHIPFAQRRPVEMTLSARGLKGLTATTCFLPVAVLMVVVASVGIAVGQTCPSLCDATGNTAVGENLLTSSGDNNTAFGAGALNDYTTGSYNNASGIATLTYNTTGGYNTASGSETLTFNTTGSYNTASGAYALFDNDGNYNTADGDYALYSNTAGSFNTATGEQSLTFNTTGEANTASGIAALKFNATGGNNTASGAYALDGNTTGGNNTASGYFALVDNNGSNNTASGAYALAGNTTGYDNTASGAYALYNNTSEFNTAYGDDALYSNTTGEANTACGVSALYFNTTGAFNTAVGRNAGSNLTTGSNNIVIANPGTAGQSNTIEIGEQGTQTATFIAGISGSAVTGADVVVNTSGELGVVVSSARYKRDIRNMGEASSNLMKLRPVTFRYKADPQATKQYGLLAEEVERQYPELVTRSADGQVQSVRYSMLTSMLLNELQKERRETQREAWQLRRQAGEIGGEAEQIKRLTATIDEVKVSTQQQVAQLKADNQRDLMAARTAFEVRLAILAKAIVTGSGGRSQAVVFNK